MLAKELHHLASICSSNLSFACAVPVARNSAVTLVRTPSVFALMFSQRYLLRSGCISLYSFAAAPKIDFTISSASAAATRLRSGGLHSLIKFKVCGQCQDTASRFVGPVPTYRLDWIVVSYSRVAIGTLIDRCDGRHWRPPTPYPC
jgi:hypothetical protein